MDESTLKRRVKLNAIFSLVLWLIGFILILIALYMNFFSTGFGGVSDGVSSRMLNSLFLGGVGFSLAGLFWALMACLKVLALMAGMGRR